jgi:hypothetical protein
MGQVGFPWFGILKCSYVCIELFGVLFLVCLVKVGPELLSFIFLDCLPDEFLSLFVCGISVALLLFGLSYKSFYLLTRFVPMFGDWDAVCSLWI